MESPLILRPIVRRSYVCLRLAVGLFLLIPALPAPAAPLGGTPADLPDPVSCNGCAYPSTDARAQYQLTPGKDLASTGGIDVAVRSRPFGKTRPRTPEVFDIDLYVDGETSSDSVPNERAVDAIHERGGYAICYVSAGSWENWRPDAGDFPHGVKGKKNGWPGERWLDISATEILLPIMQARLQKCAAAGFDAVEWDNVDGFRNDTGFPLTWSDQLEYNAALANMAHEEGLAVGLKNDLGQIEKLVEYFDFAVNEQCSQYRECARLGPFLEAGKAVFQIEYEKDPRWFCPSANRAGRVAMFKAYELGPKPWTPCR
ncbi:MAG: endo alpha-1,4 polygalactosaminidase [Actinobacteria bacterium]|nr:endo alpha-1,4 polygalactosaminidase [Actinomycetota bacterium]